MFGYQQQNHDNGLMTNLDSISSSQTSLDTIGQRRTNAKVANSNDNLIAPRSHSVASNSLIWRAPKDDRSSTIYSTSHYGRTNGSVSGRQNGSEIYGDYMNTNASMSNHYVTPRSLINHNNPKPSKLCCCCCFNPENTISLLLVPLLLLTILRQILDFMGQIWLQIIINFFTIIIIIIALFGVKQQRISYLILFIIVSLFNVTWNTLVFCVYSKIRDVGIPEDLLSFYTGTYSWWKTNGPGCLPYNIGPLQTTSISMLKQHVITGCRINYHLIESCQALIHAILTFLSLLVCSCLVTNIRRNPAFYKNFLNNSRQTDKAYRMNNLSMNRPKINQDPFPNGPTTSMSTRLAATSSLRRAPNKTSSRSSQHSVSSMRSTRRRGSSIAGAKPPRPIMVDNSIMPAPRLSTSSTMRSQKYGSISSRRSASAKKDRRADISSLTYGTTSGYDRSGDQQHQQAGPSNRDRLSSVSSVDYLPSYQPPHSSSANLLSSYGEISSVESFTNAKHANNNMESNGHKRRQNNGSTRHHSTLAKSVLKGNMNPTYTGSRSSISSRNQNTNNNNNNNNNYDDLNNVYRNISGTYANGTTHTFENRSHRIAHDNGGTMTRMQPTSSSLQQQHQAPSTLYAASSGSQNRQHQNHHSGPINPSNQHPQHHQQHQNGLSNGINMSNSSETPM